MSNLPDPKSPAFPKALQAARVAKGMGLTALAKAADIAFVMPGRYERGESSPRIETWIKLNAALFGQEAEIEGGDGSDLSPKLSTATTEELIEELNIRGYRTITLST